MAGLQSEPVFHSAIHRDRDAQFRATAPPKRIIKEKRKETVMCCTNCGKLGDNDDVDLKKCAGCKLVHYCSQQCQKENWPRHKPNCSSDFGEGIQPLIKSVTANPMLSYHLQICLVLEFSLHRLHTLPASKRMTVLRAPLFAHVDVGIEPTKITEFMNLYTFKEEWDKDDMEGMLQLHHLSSPRSWVPPRTPSSTNLAIWKQARESADEDGADDCAVVMVQFVNNFKQAISCPIVVGEDALDAATRAEPFIMCSALTGRETRKPLSIGSCFEYLNTHIRSDTKNRLLLRAPMRESDKELIRDAGRNKDAHAPQMLKLKMSRESVYVSHPLVVTPASGSGHGQAHVPLQIDAAQRDVEGEQVQRPEAAPKMNRAERRRLQREQQKEMKHRK
ncbi:hypothetical protein BDZ97DRAFT_1913561 [Flammula alnicola]|nr:hypothetical protein BDZ97DRAFT_1913561 [Flammula alnicola]